MGFVGMTYEMKQALEKEFGAISIFKFQISTDTPANNLGIEVYLGGVVYPFYVDESDFENIPLLTDFMIDHIKREKKILESKAAQ